MTHETLSEIGVMYQLSWSPSLSCTHSNGFTRPINSTGTLPLTTYRQADSPPPREVEHRGVLHHHMEQRPHARVWHQGR
jgi:hypothetical protein